MRQHTDKKGFGVVASPFNRVKLELGIILALGLLLWLFANSIIANLGAQLLLLSGYGVTAMLWLIMRTRHVLKECSRNHPQDDGHET